MKKILFLIFAMVCTVTVFAQTDTLICKNGEVLSVKIVKNTTDAVSFQYPNEDLVNEKSKVEIRTIIFASGRKEQCSKGLDVPVIASKDDWQKVVITYVESDVAGLVRVQALKGKAGGWGSYNSALKQLQKQAAKLGCGVVLVHGERNKFASAMGGSVRLNGTAYK